jgi:hypothetical protein
MNKNLNIYLILIILGFIARYYRNLKGDYLGELLLENWVFNF